MGYFEYWVAGSNKTQVILKFLIQQTEQPYVFTMQSELTQ